MIDSSETIFAKSGDSPIFPIQSLTLYEAGYAMLHYEGVVSEGTNFFIYGKNKDDLNLLLSTLRVEAWENSEKTKSRPQITIVKWKEPNNQGFNKRGDPLSKKLRRALLGRHSGEFWNDWVGYEVELRCMNRTLIGRIVHHLSIPRESYPKPAFPDPSVYEGVDQDCLGLLLTERKEILYVPTREITAFRFLNPDLQDKLEKALIESTAPTSDNNHPDPDHHLMIQSGWEDSQVIKINFPRASRATVDYLLPWPRWKVCYQLVPGDSTSKEPWNFLLSTLFSNHFHTPLPKMPITLVRKSIIPLKVPLLDSIDPIDLEIEVEQTERGISYFSEARELEDGGAGAPAGPMVNVRFRLTGIPPDQAIQLIPVNLKNTVGEIKRLVQRAYRLNPSLAIQFIYQGKVLPDNLSLAKTGFRPRRDILTVMATQGAGPGFPWWSPADEIPDNAVDEDQKNDSHPRQGEKSEVNSSDAPFNAKNESRAGGPSLRTLLRKQDLVVDVRHNLFLSETLCSGDSAELPLTEIAIPEPFRVVYAPNIHEQAQNCLLLRNDLPFTLEEGPITVYDQNGFAGQALVPRLNPGSEAIIPLGPASQVGVFFSKETMVHPPEAVKLRRGSAKLEDNLSEASNLEIVLLEILLKYTVRHRVHAFNLDPKAPKELYIVYENRDDFRFDSVTMSGLEVLAENTSTSLEKGQVRESEDFWWFKVNIPTKSDSIVEFKRSYYGTLPLHLDEGLLERDYLPSLFHNLPEVQAGALGEILGTLRKIQKTRKPEKIEDLKKILQQQRLDLGKLTAALSVGVQ